MAVKKPSLTRQPPTSSVSSISSHVTATTAAVASVHVWKSPVTRFSVQWREAILNPKFRDKDRDTEEKELVHVCKKPYKGFAAWSVVYNLRVVAFLY